MQYRNTIVGPCIAVALLAMIAEAAARDVLLRAPAMQAAPVQQTAQAQPPAATEAPQSTTATYADWVVQCVTAAESPPHKDCNMVQTAQIQGKNIPFSRVAVQHPVKGQPAELVVQVPVNVSLSANVRIQIGDADLGVTAPFARCLPGGCFAVFDLKDDVLRKFRATSTTTPGKLSFADAGGREVVVPLSFKGFGQAFDALAKE